MDGHPISKWTAAAPFTGNCDRVSEAGPAHLTDKPTAGIRKFQMRQETGGDLPILGSSKGGHSEEEVPANMTPNERE